jgi:hypothetical protein
MRVGHNTEELWKAMQNQKKERRNGLETGERPDQTE